MPKVLKHPTAATWSKYSPLEEVEIGGEVFKVGQCVGVIHDAKTVWDVQITGIGQKKTGPTTSNWLRVNWFYTAEELEKLPGYPKGKWDISGIMPEERVFSNHEDYVSADSVDGLSDIVAFDDREADIPEITGIFFRWAVDINGGPIRGQHRGCKKGCPLKGIYKPDRMRQRYCETCNIWYHVGCLELVPRVKDRRLATRDIAGISSELPMVEALLRIPIERGFLVGIAGNGQFQLALRNRLRQARHFAEDEDFFQRYLDTFKGFEHYLCPICNGGL